MFEFFGWLKIDYNIFYNELFNWNFQMNVLVSFVMVGVVNFLGGLVVFGVEYFFVSQMIYGGMWQMINGGMVCVKWGDMMILNGNLEFKCNDLLVMGQVQFFCVDNWYGLFDKGWFDNIVVMSLVINWMW